jgi:hypothetical protein
MDGLHSVHTPDESPLVGRTLNDLLATILPILPDATIEEDNYGQVVIYTGLRGDERIAKWIDPDEITEES